MSVSNGQKANQTTFNDAFASKTSDNVISGNNELTGVLSLNNTPSAPAISNVQTEINSKAPSNDARFPTTQEKAALAGTEGAPSNTNRYVTNEDKRLPGSVVAESILDNQSSNQATSLVLDESVSECSIVQIAVRRRDDTQEFVSIYEVKAMYLKDSAEWRSLGVRESSEGLGQEAGVSWFINIDGTLEYQSTNLGGANYFGEAKIINVFTFGVWAS